MLIVFELKAYVTTAAKPILLQRFLAVNKNKGLAVAKGFYEIWICPRLDRRSKCQPAKGCFENDGVEKLVAEKISGASAMVQNWIHYLQHLALPTFRHMVSPHLS